MSRSLDGFKQMIDASLGRVPTAPTG